ncbi:2Fe-2S iron-sulfur cluster-binding protein [Pelagibius marinus]|uniref:2Fe-2S iron-sulfur cluster-binding protein n=1 Tax=Pelagibius marinus TaxID=2762760 RepID=UPI001872E1C5|nr:2Fe-2S iron-sulfur cluster-binding protein [Pelagibius marinus]
MPKLTIRQWPLSIETGKATILEAALESGVPFPHGCRTGECGTCKCLLLSGEVGMRNYDKQVLPDPEKAAGFVLACRAKPRSDVHVSWMGGTVSVELPVRRLRAQVTNIEQVSPIIKRLYLWPEQSLQFAAGQFARLKFANLPARAYSFANTPGEEVLEFHIRLIPGGRISEHIDTALQVGDTVEVEGPYGSAHLRPDDEGPLVLVAGSSGLAPAKSIMRTALRNQPDRRVHLYFGVRDEVHVYDENEFKVLISRYRNLHVDTVLSKPEGETARRTGSLDQVISDDLERHRRAQFYVAGPPAMVDAVSKTLTDRGIGRDQVHADPFHAQGQDAAEQVSADGFNKLLNGVRGLLTVGRLRHPKSRERYSPEKAMEESPPPAATPANRRRLG